MVLLGKWSMETVPDGRRRGSAARTNAGVAVEDYLKVSLMFSPTFLTPADP
jgi:hypothetical protein